MDTLKHTRTFVFYNKIIFKFYNLLVNEMFDFTNQYSLALSRMQV